MAGGKGLGASDALIAIATALGNEVAAMVIRHPSLTIEEMLELVSCTSRRKTHCQLTQWPQLPFGDPHRRYSTTAGLHFEDLLRWAQNALVAFARDARDAATCSRGRRAPNLWLIAPYILLSYFEIIGIVCPDGATDGAG